MLNEENVLHPPPFNCFSFRPTLLSVTICIISSIAIKRLMPPFVTGFVFKVSFCSRTFPSNDLSTKSKMPSLLLISTLCFFALTITLANSQMTFSDGWGKRSAGMQFALLADRHMTESKRQEKSRATTNLFSPPAEEDGLAMNPAMEACQVGYAQRLMQLHEEMLNLFNTYQQCQAKAMVETKKVMQKL